MKTEYAVNHYGSIRLRVKGSGILRSTLYSYDEIYSDPQANLTMNPATATAPTLLSNFTQQEAKLDIRTTGIDETFNISQIVIFIKPVASSFPQ